MPLGALSLALLLGGVNAACAPFHPPPPPLAPEAAGDAPAQVWAARAGRRFTGRLVVHDSTIYGAGLDRKVYAVDLASGQVRWSSRLSGLVAGGVLVLGDTVYAASARPEGRLYALDAGTGRRLWRVPTGPVSAPLALVGNTLIAATLDGRVLGVDPSTGNVRWRRKVGVARVAAAPADSAAFILATVDSIFRITMADGKVLGRVRSPGTLLSPWVAKGPELVAGTTDSLIVAIRPADLAELWRVRLDAPVLGSPALRGDTIYAVTRRGTLYRVLADSAARAEVVVALDWAVTAPVTVADGLLLLGGADGVVRALRADGEEAWRLQLWRPVELGPLRLPDGILAIGGDGDLHRYRR
jgi:outer membrane protein assembly factor BamB